MKFFAGFVIGALIGTVIATLIAPRETPGMGDSVADLIGRGKALLEDARTTVDQAVAEGQRAADDQRRTLESQVIS